MKQPTRQMLQAQLDQALAERDAAYRDADFAEMEKRDAEQKLAAANALLERLNTWNETEGSTDCLVSLCEDTAAYLGMFNARRPA